MNDPEFETLIRNNLESIRQYGEETRRETREQTKFMENLVKTQQLEIEQLKKQINILFTKNFNHEATG